MRYSWLFILPIFAIVAIVTYSIYRQKTKQHKIHKSILISHSKKITALPEYERVRRNYRILLSVATITLLVAVSSITATASRPISVDVIDPDYESRDIMLCIDISGSQIAEIANVVRYFSNSMNKLHGQRIGVGVFATKAAIISPLTNDYDVLESLLRNVTEALTSNYSNYYDAFSSLGSSSAIGDGIINCASGFDKLAEDGRSQSIIVATDNYQNDGVATVVQAGNYLARYGITLYAIDTVQETKNVSSEKNERIVELRNAVKATGGLYYNLPGQGVNGSQAADNIMKQEAAKHEGVAQYAQIDSPRISAIIALCSIGAMLFIIWRLKL